MLPKAERRALVFPGQGSQSVGMGRALADAHPEARAVFDEVDDALEERLSTLIWEGPEERLTLTENAQPALLAVAIAALRALEHATGRSAAQLAGAVAGHSLGEYAALVAAGALTLQDAARALRERGRAMQAAVPVGVGAMAALLGLDLADAEAVAEEASQGEVCVAANDNAPGQVVISGHVAAVERALELAKARGARRPVRLPVSAPFHCPLMEPAALRMAEVLAPLPLAAPAPPVWANVTAGPVTDPEEVRRFLVAQVTGRVRWRETVLNLARAGFTEHLELGAGKVLSGLAKRISPDVTSRSLGTPEELAALLPELA